MEIGASLMVEAAIIIIGVCVLGIIWVPIIYLCTKER
jgi:hypothetical protein